MTNIKIVSKISTILTIATAVIALPILGFGKVFASFDHLMDYHVEVPDVFENHDRDRAEKESRDEGYSQYQDDRGETHHYIDGKEVS